MKKEQPNILLILNDDMGYSDLGCYGGEIETPNLDRLANEGLRYTQFYNTARCCPSRASLLTGLHPHQADVGHMIGDYDMDGYLGELSKDSVTIAEVLGSQGYHCCMSGKWHLTGRLDEPNETWPRQRGFDRYYGMLTGAGSYYSPKTHVRENELLPEPEGDFYFTDAISDEAVRHITEHFSSKPDQPLFQYLAYTAPHWPLHAREEDIEKYRGRYDGGWDQIREERLQRMADLGLIDRATELSPRDSATPAWEEEPNKEWQARRMEVYAAMIDRMDQGIGRVLRALEEAGELDNTLVLFLADNGGCHEEIGADWSRRILHGRSARRYTRDGRPVRAGNDPSVMPGPEDTYQSYGLPWANVSNTPFRKYKSWVHEGGISTPLLVHWPQGMEARGEFRRQPAQLPDIMATVLEATGCSYPETFNEQSIQPMEGYSLLPTFADPETPTERPYLAWEHEGKCGIRRGRYKLVRECDQPWELYDIASDRSELHDLAAEQPGVLEEMAGLYEQWAQRVGVQPWRKIVEQRERIYG